MNAMHRQQIGRAFSAASEYDQHARVQRIVAAQLARQIAELNLPPRPRILEIGCGTGFLTEALIDQGIGGDWLITDISPDMVERCRQRIEPQTGRHFAVLDGEYGTPDSDQPFDLICSSLAVQWFDDQEAALTRMLEWLAPDGHCIFTTLGAGTFAEWAKAHEDEGFTPGTPPYPSLEELSARQVPGWHGSHQAAHHVETHDSARDFIRSLKLIGAGTAPEWHRPLGPSALRRVMRNFEAAGASVSYEVITCHYTRAGAI